MEKSSNQELIEWDEEMQTNVNKGFCSPDDVLNLSGDQIDNVGLAQHGSGGEASTSFGVHYVSGMEETSGGTQHEQPLSAEMGADQLMRVPLSLRAELQYESQFADSSDGKPASPSGRQGKVGHAEAISSEEGPVITKLGPVPPHSTLTENSAENTGGQLNASSFPSCLPENILDGMNLNVSEVGGRELLAPYTQKDQGIHTISTAQSTAVDRILYGFDLTCERDGDQYTSLDQMTYEYDVACGEEEVQYTSLDPVSYSFDVSCEADEDLNTSVDPMSYEFEVSCTRDDDEMVCFSQSTLDDGKIVDIPAPSTGSGKAINEAHSALQSWPGTELVIGPLEHQSNVDSSSSVSPLRNEGSCKRMAVTEICVDAPRDQMLPMKEDHRTEQAVTSLGKDCIPAEMKQYPDYCEPAPVCCHQYLSTSEDKEPSQSGMDERFSKQHNGGSAEPTNTSVTNYTLSLCQAASWDCSSAVGADCVEKLPQFPTTSADHGMASSRATSVHSSESSSNLSGSDTLDVPGSGSAERPDLTGQVVQATEKETEAIQSAAPLFAASAQLPDDKEMPQESAPSQNREAVNASVLAQTGLNAIPGGKEEAAGGVEISADASSLASAQPSNSGEPSALTSTSTGTICQPPPEIFGAGYLNSAEEGVGASPGCDQEGTSKQLCLARHEEGVASEESGGFAEPAIRAKSSASVTSREPGQNLEQVDDYAEPSKIASDRTQLLSGKRNENEERLAKGMEESKSKELPIECRVISKETSAAFTDVAGTESEETFKPRPDLSNEHNKVAKYLNVTRDYRVDCAKPLLAPASGLTLPNMCEGETQSRVTPAAVATRNPVPLGEPSLYTCTKCSVYFQDREYLHRHMLDHFDGQAEEGLVGGLRPFACHECGHAFCDPASLQMHLSLHQERRASFMEAIQELTDPWAEGHGARRQGTLGASSTKLPVEHAKAHAQKTPHPCHLCTFQAATAEGLQEHQWRSHPGGLEKSRSLRTPSLGMPPQAAKTDLRVNKECPSFKRTESLYKDPMKLGQPQLYQQKAGCPPTRSAWPSASQGAADSHSQSDKCESSPRFLPSSALGDGKPEGASLPSTARGPCCYEGDRPLLFQGDLKNKMALEVPDVENAKLRTHSVLGLTKRSVPQNSQYKPPIALLDYPSLRESTGTTLPTLARGSFGSQKGAIYSSHGLQKKKMEMVGEHGTSRGNVPSYRTIVIDHFSSRMTNSGSLIHKDIVKLKTSEEGTAGNKSCHVSFDQPENPEQNASGLTEHQVQIGDIRGLPTKKGRLSTEPTAASCRPRAVKKHTRELLETINLPQDLSVDQHQQLVRMTSLIVLDKMESQSEGDSVLDEKELDSSMEPWESQLQGEARQSQSQHEARETQSQSEGRKSQSQHEARENQLQYEARESQSQCKSREIHLQREPREIHSQRECREIHSQHEPREIHSLHEPREIHSLCEPREIHSQREPREIHSQREPKESQSQREPVMNQSQREPRESQSQCEPVASQSQCEPMASMSQREPSENHSQREPVAIQSPQEPRENHSQREPRENHSQREPMVSQSQREPISEERELASSVEAGIDKGIFWEVPSEDLPIDLMKKSKDLLSKNLLRMFPLEERECPYCPDKFHTGIGLANHVRGHLKRVGISYNTRHFISAEEVTAIEKEFSLQKLKRKALKIRGSAVEKCNLCGANFDSRAGMSSHARAHLRELGVMTWSATSSPIDLLNELLQDLVPPSLTDGRSIPDTGLQGARGHKPGAAAAAATKAAGSEGSNPRPLMKPFASVNNNSPPLRNKVVIIDPDDDEMSTLELELPSGHSSGEPELREKNELLGTLDTNSQTTPVHPKQPLPKIALVTQGEDSLQSNKLLNSCQLCGTCFETRKGLSSHARFHLRQFGVPDSESSGAPIGTLYELMKRKGIPSVLPSTLASDKPQSCSPKDMSGLKQEAPGKPLGEECQGETTHIAKSPKLAMNSPPKGQSQAGSSTLKKVHPILPKPMSSKSPEQGKTGRSLMNTPQTSGELLSKKLFWSPQDDNTPLNLTVNSEHISCRLCGACFETRKGLSSHSRAHLRHFGAVDVDSKGSPIEALNEFIKKKGIQSPLSSMLPIKKAPSYPKVSALKAERTNFKLGAPVNKKTSLTSPSMSTQKKLKQVTMSVHMESGISQASRPNNELTSETYWPSSPINLSIDSAPSKETRCEFCGDYFENRKGLSSHARSHLRQFGVTEWTVNGSPIDTLKELMKRKMYPLESSATSELKMPSKPATSLKSPTQGMQSEPFSPSPGKSSKFSLTIPSVRQVPSGSLVPKKIQGQFLSPPPLKKLKPTPLKKVKQEHFKVEYNPEEPATSLKSDSYLPEQMWSPSEDTSPLRLTVDQPSKDVCCEFCGEYFENRKGLSSHARSHLRQFGVTEWTVNGSPIDTLKELMKRKGKPEPLGHEPMPRELQQEAENYLYEEKPISKPFGQLVKSSAKEMQHKHLTPPARKVLTYTPNSQHPTGSPLGKKIPMGFVSTAPLKKPMLDERNLTPEFKPSYTPESGLFKPKTTWSPQEKVATSPVIATDTCCELCGHYFENRKALASHARAHLRQFGVTEWHINGSPIDTLREWIRQKPNIGTGASLNCVQDRPLPKPIKNNIKSVVKELSGELCSLPGGKTVKLEPMQPKTVELGFPASPVQKNPETEKMPPTECYIPTDLSQGSITECTPSSSMPSEDDEPHPKKKRSRKTEEGWGFFTTCQWIREKHPVKLGTCEYCGVTLTTGVGLSNHMRGHLKSGLKRKLPSLSQFEELHEKAEPALTDTYYERKQHKPVVCTENVSPKREEGKEPKTFRPKSEEPRPLRVRPVIFPVPKPEPLSLVKFIGNIYTLKCRFCDVEFHGPLSIQEDWVRHLQRHILDMNFPKAEAAREEICVSTETGK
ncbi:uncharacterized protein si:ch211-194b1.1 [Carcharodon carcharias]|uniref:uncharacterized protein si:ch211-194b1.1 n=1 Tax=Carcharodon carcharias TaxID=13397 RepID=UPI001B7DC460|nr:uncharacterized protein si:ch211-194b1.1 [Carcharodon carcharias]